MLELLELIFFFYRRTRHGQRFHCLMCQLAPRSYARLGGRLLRLGSSRCVLRADGHDQRDSPRGPPERQSAKSDSISSASRSSWLQHPPHNLLCKRNRFSLQSLLSRGPIFFDICFCRLHLRLSLAARIVHRLGAGLHRGLTLGFLGPKDRGPGFAQFLLVFGRARFSSCNVGSRFLDRTFRLAMPLLRARACSGLCTMTV